MNITIKLITTIIYLSAFVCLAAQTDERAGHYEQKGEELIDKAAEKINSYETLIIDFSYITDNTQQDAYDTDKGVIILKGDKYNISLDEHKYISNGKTVWACMKDVKEVHISSAENIEQSMNPVYLLSEFQQHYRAKFIRQENILGTIVNLVDVVPNKPHSFFKYRIAVEDSNNMIAYIKAYDRHGGTYKIQFDEVQKNIDVPGERFTFNVDEYPDMDIIDLR